MATKSKTNSRKNMNKVQSKNQGQGNINKRLAKLSSGKETDEETQNDSVLAMLKPALSDELSNVPLGDILALKEHIGTKMYKEAVFGVNEEDQNQYREHGEYSGYGRYNGNNKYGGDGGYGGNDGYDRYGGYGGYGGRSGYGGNSGYASASGMPFKRKEKFEPLEVSATTRPSRFRTVFTVKKKGAYDPRFADNTGTFSKYHFQKQYGFLNEMKEEEYKMLKDELKSEKDFSRKRMISETIKRIDNKNRSEAEEKRKHDLIVSLRKTNMERMKKGQKPYYLKKAELDRRLRDEKLEALEKEGKLEKYLSRKEKKLSSKKKIPFKV